MVSRVPRPASNVQARKRDGAFYTSPEVVKLMVRLALGNYLLKLLEDNRQIQPGLVVPVTALESLVWDHQVGERTDTSDSESVFTLSVREQLLRALAQVTILDPAVGQGAFLLGALEELVKLRILLGDTLTEEQLRQLMLKDNLFGIDQDLAAVDCCHQQGLINVTCEDSLLTLPGEWGQFDIVLANPPYVRQEFLSSSYKKSLVQQFQALGIELQERSDLYVYFFARLGALLKPAGTGVIIASSAWLDVAYGSSLQACLLKNYDLKVILESACERWFGDAGVNTGIVLLQKHQLGQASSVLCTPEDQASSLSMTQQTGSIQQGTAVKFVQLKRCLSEFGLGCSSSAGECPEWQPELSLSQLIGKITRSTKPSEEPEMRVYPIKQEELWAKGMVEQVYLGSKWGKYFRAPAVYFKILARAQQRLCPLGQVAKVHFGLKTGCNQFFYLKGSQLELVEQEYLVPVVKSPREVLGVTVEPDRLKYRLLAVTKEPAALYGKLVWEYITWGEQQGYHLRPSTRGRVWWYSLARNQGQGFLFRRFFYDRFNLPVVSAELTEDQTFYRVVYAGDPLLLGAIVNSTIMALFIEMSGRLALGEGVLQFAVYEASQVLVANPDQLAGELVEKLKQAFSKLAARATEAIFCEVQQQDRQALDLLLLESLGFEGDEAREVLAEVYQAVSHLVRQRLARAHTILN